MRKSERDAELRLDVVERLRRAEIAERLRAERDPVRGRDARGSHLVLGDHLVHAADAGGDARPDVRQTEDLEQLLDRAVLAAGPVQGDEDGVGPPILER